VLVQCTVESVRVHTLTGQHVVMLQPKESDRFLPIWIGADQAASIATQLAGIRADRPLTHDLMVDMLKKVGVEITRVVVRDLVESGDGNGVFHGSIFIQAGEREIEVDSRASDAIALALRCDARILVADTVLDRSSIRPDGGETNGGDDDELSIFKQFINTLPDDPAAG
jgi:bifunctional DNase/RNase